MAVKSADRALDLLECVAAASAPLSFTQLLTQLGIPKSSLFHLINNLVDRNYLLQTQGGYQLGPGVASLARRLAPLPLPVLVEPFLRQLAGELNETAGFYVRRDDSVEIIAAAPGDQALNVSMKVGDLAPLYSISPGKIVIAHMKKPELAAYLDRVEFKARTPHTVTSKSRLEAEIRKVRESGFAYAQNEYSFGIAGIATGVVAEGVLLGSLNFAIPTARFAPEREPALKKALNLAAAALAKVLRPHQLT